MSPESAELTKYVANALLNRLENLTLGLDMTDAQIKTVTLKIKAMADVRPLAIDDADSIIRSRDLPITTFEMPNWRTRPLQYQHGDRVVTMVVPR